MYVGEGENYYLTLFKLMGDVIFFFGIPLELVFQRNHLWYIVSQ